MRDNLADFLYLYQKWATTSMTKAILLGFMIVIASIVTVIGLVDEAENREALEKIVNILLMTMAFIAGIGFGVLVIAQLKMRKLQEKL